MEFSILYWIQNLHSDSLNTIMVTIFNDIVGSKGEIWIILGMILLLIPKTRKVGLCTLSAYIIAYYVGDGILKDLRSYNDRTLRAEIGNDSQKILELVETFIHCG